VAVAARKRRLAPVHVIELHVFLATAAAKDGFASGCAPGERHSLLIFCRQGEGEAADERLARKCASAAGWTAIKLERSKRLPVTAVPQEAVLGEAFREALKDGFAVVAHRRQEDRPAYKPAA
jgi:hypothetical protein